MTAPALLEPLNVEPRLVHVEEPGCAPVTLIVQPLSGVSAEAHAALNLPPGPSAVLTWMSRSALGHEQVGAAFLAPGQDLQLALALSGLADRQAQACAECLAKFVTWEGDPS